MPGHVDPGIGYPVLSPEQFKAKLNELKQHLLTDLRVGFEQALGLPIPSADHAEILIVDTALKYVDQVMKGDFLAGMRELANAKFSGDDAIIAQKSIVVAKNALSEIFEEGGSVRMNVHGDSAKLERGGMVHVAAAYASTSLCSKDEWYGEQRDFYVSEYVFTVFQVAPHLRALLKVRSI